MIAPKVIILSIGTDRPEQAGNFRPYGTDSDQGHLFYSEFTSLSTIFQSYCNSVWMWQGALCLLLECCFTAISCPRGPIHMTWYFTQSLFYCHLAAQLIPSSSFLTLFCWTRICPAFANSADPDHWPLKKPTDLDLHCLQLSNVNLYQQTGSNNLIGWKLEIGMAS